MPDLFAFSWDDQKALQNERKHGLRFDDAVRVFEDPFALSEMDRIEGNETRWQTIGLLDGLVVILVAHSYWDEDEEILIRIISARRADRKERQNYERERRRKAEI